MIQKKYYVLFIIVSKLCLAKEVEVNNENINKTIINSKDSSELVQFFLKKNKLIEIKDKSDQLLIDFINNKTKWDRNND
ncbi:hypothetical protein GNP73_08410 [Aliivibrio fischeri]|uniref:hypothetical protein n=1 Tax=Aliivibrio fischeri TaxID=668 RepID=UPI0012DA3548|nr:hypothetical protein [Aliivibrio fischeri]MUJ27996.1 hypothetical protein [Aliivibrio fischeri]